MISNSKNQYTRKQLLIVLSMLLVIFAMTTSNAFAQGDYLDKGESGLEISFGYSTNDFADGYMGVISLTSNATTEFSFAVSHVSAFNYDYSVFSPSLTYYPIKPELNSSPVGVALNVGFELGLLSGSAGGLQTSTGAHFGVATFLQAKLSENVKLQPEFAYLYSVSTDFDEGLSGTSLSISTFIKLSSGSVLRINPGVSFVEGETTSSINIGFILPEK